jgi:hypothetical protein
MLGYDRHRFNPPAPLAYVSLVHQTTGAVHDRVPMLLDTGADATLIPRAAAEALGVAIDLNHQYELEDYGGRVEGADVVRLDILFLGRTMHGTYPIIDQEWGVLGRNILNSIPLVFDGPRLRCGEANVVG